MPKRGDCRDRRLAVLSAPSSEQTLGQQAQQALTEETGICRRSLWAQRTGRPGGRAARGARDKRADGVRAVADDRAGRPGELSRDRQPRQRLQGRRGRETLAGRGSAGRSSKQRSRARTRRRSSSQRRRRRPAVKRQRIRTPSGAAVPGSWSDVSASFASTAGTPYAWSGGQACDQNIYAETARHAALRRHLMTVAAAGHYANLIRGRSPRMTRDPERAQE